MSRPHPLVQWALLAVAAVVVMAMALLRGPTPPAVDRPPLDRAAAREVLALCEAIAADAGEQADGVGVTLRSVAYAVEGDVRHVAASFCAEGKEGVAWHDLRLELAAGGLRLRPDSVREVSAAADAVVPLREAGGASVRWPVPDETHAALAAEAERLLGIYLDGLRAALRRDAALAGSVARIEYVTRPPDGAATVRVRLAIEDAGEPLLETGVDLTPADGQYRPSVPDPPSEGTPLAKASASALGRAVEQWLATAPRDSVLER